MTRPHVHLCLPALAACCALWAAACDVTVDLGELPAPEPLRLEGCITLTPQTALSMGPTVVGRPVQTTLLITNCRAVAAPVAVRVEGGGGGGAFALALPSGEPWPGALELSGGGQLTLLLAFVPVVPGGAAARVLVDVGNGLERAERVVEGTGLGAPVVVPRVDCTGGAVRVVEGSLVLGPGTDVRAPQTALALRGINPRDCFEVTQDVVVLGTDLPDLEVLGGLVGVGRDLQVGHPLGGNPLLRNVDGLANLRRVDGTLQVLDNATLRTVDGLLAVRRVGANVLVQGNPALLDVAGMASVTEVVGDVTVQSNRRLRNLSGLAGLTTIGGALRITGNLFLSDIQGLGALRSVGGTLSVSFNDTLKTLEGLTGLTEVGTYLGIQGNASLASLSGLDGVLRAGDVVVSQNPSLLDVSGLKALRSATLLVVSGNARLGELRGLSALTDVERDLIIEDNAALVGLGLGALTEVGNLLVIRSNPRLPTSVAQALAAQVEPLVTDIRNNGGP